VGDWHLDNLCRSRLQSEVIVFYHLTLKMAFARVVETSVATTVLFRTPITQVIVFNQGNLSSMSYFLCFIFNCGENDRCFCYKLIPHYFKMPTVHVLFTYIYSQIHVTIQGHCLGPYRVLFILSRSTANTFRILSRSTANPIRILQDPLRSCRILARIL